MILKFHLIDKKLDYFSVNTGVNLPKLPRTIENYSLFIPTNDYYFRNIELSIKSLAHSINRLI